MTVISRELRESDIPIIGELFKKNPYTDIPSLNNMIINTTLENTKTKKIVGYGAVKLYAEAKLFLDHYLPKRDRAEGLVQAMQTAILYCRDAGVETLYANSNDEDFTKVLEKRYSFKRVPGTLLFLDLNSNHEDI